MHTRNHAVTYHQHHHQQQQQLESSWSDSLQHPQAPSRLAATNTSSLLTLPPLKTISSDNTFFFTTPSPSLQPTSPLLAPPPRRNRAITPCHSNPTLGPGSLPRLSDVTCSPVIPLLDASTPSKRSCFPKKCDFPLCKNSARSRGFCYSHGGGRRCRVDTCNNGAVSRDLCKRHGGGRRCHVVNCKSSAESGGLCYSHGGGRRCRLSGCSARAKKGGLCVVHLTGGTRTASVAGGADTLLTDTSSEGSDVVETLLALAKEQPLEDKMKCSGDWRGGSAAPSAYAITSLLN